MPFVIGLERARELLYLGDPIDAQDRPPLRDGEPGGAEGRAAGGDAEVRPPDGPHLARSAGRHQAGHQSGARRRPASGNAIHAGLDVLAPVYAARTEVGVKFDEIRDKEGLGAALRWRAAQFAE